MKTWKNGLVPTLFALGGVLSLVPAVLGPVIKGKPFDHAFLAIAFVFFTFAAVFFAVGRRPRGGSGTLNG
jgi:hypothetical protein